MILSRNFACFFAASICSLSAAPVTVPPKATGLFGWPSRSSTEIDPQNTVMVKIADFTKAGQAVEITASGIVEIYVGRSYGRISSGPDGIDLPRVALQNRDGNRATFVFTPEEDGILSRGDSVPAEDMQRVMARFAGLVGGFADAASIASSTFSANKSGKVPMGIPAESIFWVGSHKVFIASGPGSLFVGVNDTDPYDSSGNFTVEALPVKGIKVMLQNAQVTEGGDLVGTFTVMDPLEEETEFTVSVPGEGSFGRKAILVAPGATTGTFNLKSGDNELIERHRSLAVQITAPTFAAGEQEFEYFDNDWVGLDEDGDQMSDIWQKKYQIASWDTDSDSDGDGYSNFEEDKWGTNPASASSRPEIRYVQQGGISCVIAPTQPGFRFQIYGSSNITDFAPISEIIEGTGLAMEIEVPTASETRYFFKRVAVGAEDSDLDGLSDIEEKELGTDPLRSDTDGDGSSDKYEVSRFAYFQKINGAAARSLRVPTGPGSGSDMDKYPKDPTNPLDPDSDNDGIPDGAELAFFVQQGIATRRKTGFPPYVLPTDANAPIPIYLQEEKSWTGVTTWSEPEGAPCVPDFSKHWSSGFIRRAFSVDGFLTATSDNAMVQDNLDRAIGNPVGVSYSPAAWAYGGVRPGGGSVTELSQSSIAFSGMFHPGRPTTFGCLYSNGQVGYKASYDIYADIQSTLSDEITTPQNIDLAFIAAEPGHFNSSGDPGAYVRVADGEREARVGRIEYKIGSANGRSVKCATVFVPANGTPVEYGDGGDSGKIPDGTELGESGIFWITTSTDPDGCYAVDKSNNLYYTGSVNSFSCKLNAAGDPHILDTNAPSPFEVNTTGGTGAATWAGGLKQLAVNLNFDDPILEPTPFTVKLGGVEIYKGTLLPISQPIIAPEEVTFPGSFPLYTFATDEVQTAPDWSSAGKSNLVALPRNGALSVAVKLAVEGTLSTTCNWMLKAVGPDGLESAPVGVSPSGRNITATLSFPQTLPNQFRYYGPNSPRGPFKIQWLISGDGGSNYAPLTKQTEHELCLVKGSPLIPCFQNWETTLPKAYDAAVRVGCRAIDGTSDSSEAMDILNSMIDAEFLYAPQNPAYSGHPLELFIQSAGPSEGIQCLDNATILEGIGKSIGIEAKMAIAFGGEGATMLTRSDLSATMKFTRPALPEGVPENPLFLFHAVVLVDGVYYDPSYGSKSINIEHENLFACPEGSLVIFLGPFRDLFRINCN